MMRFRLYMYILILFNCKPLSLLLKYVYMRPILPLLQQYHSLSSCNQDEHNRWGIKDINMAEVQLDNIFTNPLSGKVLIAAIGEVYL